MVVLIELGVFLPQAEEPMAVLAVLAELGVWLQAGEPMVVLIELGVWLQAGEPMASPRQELAGLQEVFLLQAEEPMA